MTVDQYIDTISKRYKQGNTTEHTFRGDLQQLIESIAPNIRATNEPKRQACGAPDYILTKQEIPIGYIEAKDIGDNDLSGDRKNGNKEQFDRYKASLNNIIFTDYLSFHVYRNGQFLTQVSIGTIENEKIKPIPENFLGFENLIKDFCSFYGQTIQTSSVLAEMMAKKARILNEVILKAIQTDYEDNTTLLEQYAAFQKVLIHDLTKEDFSDFYAQSIAYGMFAARFHNMTLKTFSRQDATYLIPKSNPFLSKLFTYIAGPDIDDRILWIVDALADIFKAVDTEKTLQDFQSHNGTEDPFIHFYEYFLEVYDSKLRKQRGVYYTPLPIVEFIIRSVDLLLQDRELFNIKNGLADSTLIETKAEKIHQVQILDFATGTGTFLNEIVKHIYKKFENQKGLWSIYVEENLIPRLHGFEILMAPYTMCHTKIELLLAHTNYKPKDKPQRLKVYLTNTLENSYIDTTTFFDKWLTHESAEAQKIKREKPLMVILGNPPYSNFGDVNNSEWILDQLKVYKEGLEEKKLNLDDDYIKFIRYAEEQVERTGYGIVGIVTNNSFIDGITHRQMRKHLMETFDRIYILDLHGSAKKKETTKEGDKDENVFNIQQGTCITLFIKTREPKKTDLLSEVYFSELYGTRESKYKFLQTKDVSNVKWKKLKPMQPYYFFVKKDFKGEREYKKGFSIPELMPVYNSGIQTDRDELFIDFKEDALKKRMIKLLSEELEHTFKAQYRVKDSTSYKITARIKNKKFNEKYIKKILYRPFDYRSIYYDPSIISRPAEKVMNHIISFNNIGLITLRLNGSGTKFVSLVTDQIVEKGSLPRSNYSLFPLYLYEEPFTGGGGGKKKSKNPDEKSRHEQSFSFALKAHSSVDQASRLHADGRITAFNRVPNLNMDIVNKFASILGIPFSVDHTVVTRASSSQADGIVTTFTPLDILDYIYAILHSPSYREKYKEFLKIDFPRVPYPDQVAQASRLNAQENDSNKQDARSTTESIDQDGRVTTFKELFFKLVNLGSQLRQIHLLESPKVEEYITEYPVDGSNRVEYIVNRTSSSNTQKNDSNKQDACSTTVTMRIYINETQYFDNVPEVAWNFYIGGYQPAQKWLKDRKDRKLEFEDILHYQKIIVALTETDRLMKEIDLLRICKS